MNKTHFTAAGSAAICLVGSVFAANGTGFFKSNGSAELTLTPVLYISGTVPDTSYHFSVKGDDSVSFSLPVEQIVSVADSKDTKNHGVGISLVQQKLSIDAGVSMAYGRVSIATLSGREVAVFGADQFGKISADLSPFSRGVYVLSGKSAGSSFSAKMNFSGTNGSVTGVNLSGSKRIHAEIAQSRGTTSATYRLDAKSSDPAFGDLSNQTVTIAAGPNGTKTITLPSTGDDPIVTNFKSLLDSATYDKLFPKRFGLGRANSSWDTSANVEKIPSDGDFDFYTYRSLMAALKAIGEVRVEVWNREGGGAEYASKIKWFNKKTGDTKEFITHDDYNADWNLELKEVKTADVDFATFCAEGDLTTRKRELAAFLANISHETTGMGSEEPLKIWGLYWREEVLWQNGSTELGYIDGASTTYPPYPGKSYHGRGPIQISWNANYGQVSEFLFGDKNVLLKQPELVLDTDSDNDGVADAMLAFQTAIWFWMYPQAPKPSCHDVMVGNWKPSAEDIAKGRDKSQFGMTINVINGGQECGKGDGLSSPVDRIGFYRKYCDFMQVPVPEDQYCDCGTMEYIQ